MNSNSFMRVRVQKKHFFEFKFEFGKMIEFFRVQVRVRSPDLNITSIETATGFLKKNYGPLGL